MFLFFLSLFVLFNRTFRCHNIGPKTAWMFRHILMDSAVTERECLDRLVDLLKASQYLVDCLTRLIICIVHKNARNHLGNRVGVLLVQSIDV